MTADLLLATCKDEARTVVNTSLGSVVWKLGVFKGVPTYATEGARGIRWIYARPVDAGTAFFAIADCRDCGGKRMWKVANARRVEFVYALRRRRRGAEVLLCRA